MRIIVIGGGISGLSAANRLLELRSEKNLSFEVILLEGSGRAGGTISTRYLDGFLIEEGPDSFITAKPWALSLCRRIGLDSELIPTNEAYRNTFVVHQGRLVSIPEGFLMLAPTRFLPVLKSPLFSWRGKLRMALDLALPRERKSDDESLSSFITRRLGREVLERLAQPLISGIYTADPEKLSLRATMPQFLEMEEKHGSVIKGMLLGKRAKNRDHYKESGARYSIFVSFKEGMQTLVDALSARLPKDALRLNQIVKRVVMTAEGWRVFTNDCAWLDVDGIIIATPAYQAAALVEGLDPLLAEDLSKIQYSSSAVINLAYKRNEISHPLDGFGFVVPIIEKLNVIACSFSSVKFPGRAPAGSVLLRCFVGGALNPEVYELDDSRLINTAHKEICSLLGIKGEPLFALLNRHPQSMPQYHVGHLKHIAQINSTVSKHKGLALAGNAYNGVGIPDCVRSGEEAAEALLSQILSKDGS
ncbi:MAG: protoporphyrinogen oxidase [Candidatus Dadabacteria bacterium]|nr:protoporphyrinogen oxidase [Candidatus Dadabacteria bacterium]